MTRTPAWTCGRRHRREVQTWGVTGAGAERLPGADPDDPAVDYIDTVWRPHLTIQDKTETTYDVCGGGNALSTSAADGGGSGRTRIYLLPSGQGVGLLVLALPQTYDVQRDFHFEDCLGHAGDGHTTETGSEQLSGILVQVPDLAFLKATPGDPDRFVGQQTILHDETPITGGTIVIDTTVTWDLTRQDRD